MDSTCASEHANTTARNIKVIILIVFHYNVVTYIDYLSREVSVEFVMSMIINYFYENFSCEGKPLNDTLFLSFSSIDNDKKQLEKPLLSPAKGRRDKTKVSKNKFSIEGC